MAYNPKIPPALLANGIGGATGLRHFAYKSNTDTVAQILAAGYFTNAAKLGMRPGDALTFTDPNNDRHHLQVASIADVIGAGTVEFPIVSPLSIPTDDLEDISLYPATVVGFQNGRQFQMSIEEASATLIPVVTKEQAEAGIYNLGRMTPLRTTQQIAKLVGITPEMYGAKGDGVTDDTVAFRLAMDAAEQNQVTLYLPNRYNLATWTTRNSTFVQLRGAGKFSTRITGPKIVGTHFVNMLGGTYDVKGVEFQKFDHVYYSEATVDFHRTEDCKAKWCRGYLSRQADITDFPNSSIGLSVFSNNDVEKQGGAMLHGGISKGAIAANNRCVSVGRDLAVWPGDPMFQTFGISHGDTDNNAASVAQMLTRDVVVVGNIINGVYNATPAGTFNTTNGIQVSAVNAVISGNNISGGDAADRSNCEPIYCKAQNYSISDNPINDWKTTSCLIAVKGTRWPAGPQQKNSIVARNPMSSSDGLCTNAIVLFAGGYCDVMQNPIDGMAGVSITVLGDPIQVRIKDNAIRNNGGRDAILFACGSITDCEESGNTIDGMAASTGALTPIRAVCNSRQISDITVVSGGSNVGGAGYSGTLPLAFSGGGGSATGQCTVINGVVVGAVAASDTNYTSAPTVTVVGTNGGTATLQAVLSNGKIAGFKSKGTRINWSPKAANTQVCAVYIQADTAQKCDRVFVEQVEANADAASTSTAIQGVNMFSATPAWMGAAGVLGLKMTGPSLTALQPVLFNSSQSVHAQDAYDSFTIRDLFKNGMPARQLSRVNIEENKATFVVKLAGASVGSKLIGYIPYSVMVTRASLFATVLPASATNAAKISFSLGTPAQKQILNDALPSAFTANGFTQCIPDGTAANSKRAFASSGLVAVYMDVTVEALTAGVLTLTLETEAIPN